MEKNLIDTSKAVNEFMDERGWQGRSCSACGKTFSLNRQAKWIHLSADGTNAIRSVHISYFLKKKENFDARENQREDG